MKLRLSISAVVVRLYGFMNFNIEDYVGNITLPVLTVKFWKVKLLTFLISNKSEGSSIVIASRCKCWRIAAVEAWLSKN